MLENVLQSKVKPLDHQDMVVISPTRGTTSII